MGLSLNNDHSISTFSTCRGIRFKPKWGIDVIRVDTEPIVNGYDYDINTVEDFIYNEDSDNVNNENSENSDNKCDNTCCCDACAIGVSDFDELGEEITINSRYDPKYFTHIINDYGWDESDVIYKGTKWMVYLFKNKTIYNNISDDIVRMKTYCKDNNIKPVWW